MRSVKNTHERVNARERDLVDLADVIKLDVKSLPAGCRFEISIREAENFGKNKLNLQKINQINLNPIRDQLKTENY